MYIVVRNYELCDKIIKILCRLDQCFLEKGHILKKIDIAGQIVKSNSL